MSKVNKTIKWDFLNFLYEIVFEDFSITTLTISQKVLL